MEVFVTVAHIASFVCVSVYNWSLQQVEDWLLVSVELPQYAESFRRHQLDGKALPRWASASYRTHQGLDESTLVWHQCVFPRRVCASGS